MGAMLLVVAFAIAAAGCGEEDSGVPVEWLRAVPTADGRVVKVGYETDPCTRARTARVKVGDRAITLTLFDPERDPERACILIAVPRCATVRLPMAVGRRRLLDGAPNPFPQTKRGANRLPFSRCTPVPVEG